jgi:hypothetical protein
MAARFVTDPRLALYKMTGMSIPTVKLAGALANWKLVFGDYVPNESESDTQDEWLARLAYASQAHQSSKPVSDQVMVSKFKPEYRLRPMSLSSIERYWYAQLFASKLPSCPPIGRIKLPLFLR